jgi:hypothetical protein
VESTTTRDGRGEREVALVAPSQVDLHAGLLFGEDVRRWRP